MLRSREPIKWLFYGDSITHGALHTFGHRDYAEHFADRVRYEMGRVRDVVTKATISGDTTVGLLGDFEWRVKQFQPHVVFVMIGLNDCSTGRDIPLGTFRTNLKTLREQIESLPGLPVFQTTYPILPNTSPERSSNFDAYMDAIREAAKDGGVPFIDHTAHWREQFRAKPGLHSFWMSDSFHPNHHGHLVFAEKLFRDLGIHDAQSPTCRLFHP